MGIIKHYKIVKKVCEKCKGSGYVPFETDYGDVVDIECTECEGLGRIEVEMED